jgi:hypothetical protein
MLKSWSHSRGRATAILLLAGGVAATLAGCGAGGFAQESPGADAFLDRVQTNCGKFSVGHQPIGWLLSDSSTDTTFVDATTKLFSGQFSRSDYQDYLASFYPGGTSQATVDCSYNQL